MAKHKNKNRANASTPTSHAPSVQQGKKRTQLTAAFEIDDIFATKKPKPALTDVVSSKGPVVDKAKEKDKKGKGKGKAVEQVPVKKVEQESDEEEHDSEDQSDDSSAEFDPEQEDEAEIDDDDDDDDENISKKPQPQTLDSISAAILANKNTKPKLVGSGTTRVVETVVDGSSAIERYRPPPMDGVGIKLDENELRFRDSRGDTRKRTDEGYPIYDTKELKIGLGGGTPDCPFDCQCCF